MKQLCCIFGKPVGHSLSPKIHNHLFEKFGMNMYYEAFELDDIYGGVELIKNENIVGVSVTIPFKETIIPYLDKLTQLAEKIGAVNTVINDNGKLIGDNTDAYGVIQTLNVNNVYINNKNVVMLGTGGAAKSVVFSMLSENTPASFKIVGRKQDNPEFFLKNIKEKFPEKNILLEYYSESLKYSVKESDDIIINTTPVGMTPDTDMSPVDSDNSVYSDDKVFFDVIYTPEKTLFLKDAEKNNCKIINGKLMFAFQALRQHYLWTRNEKACVEDILEIL